MQGKTLANTTSIFLLPLFLNDANIKCSRSKLDEKYVTPKIQINDANELVVEMQILRKYFMITWDVIAI